MTTYFRFDGKCETSVVDCAGMFIELVILTNAVPSDTRINMIGPEYLGGDNWALMVTMKGVINAGVLEYLYFVAHQLRDIDTEQIYFPLS